MAVIKVRPTNGNDANSGLTDALAKQTIAGALAIYASGDEIELWGNEGNHVLTADVSTAQPIFMFTKAGHSRARITGNYRIYSTSTSPAAKCENIFFDNRGTNNVGLDLINGTNSIAYLFLNNCLFYTKVAFRSGATTGRITLNNSKFHYPVYANNSTESSLYTTNSLSNGNWNARNCEFSGKLFNSTFAIGISIQSWIGNKFIYNSGVTPLRITQMLESMFYDFIWNTIDGANSFIEYVSATTVVSNNLLFERNYINCTGQIILNSSTGTLSMEQSGPSNNNILSTSTGTTGYYSTNDLVSSTPMFYDSANLDYRIEIDSPLADLNGDTVGALVPEWDAFWDDHVATELKFGVSKRSRSRTPNITGLLVEGEDDPNKVLNTSTKITGNYIPVSSANIVKAGEPFGLSQTGNRTDATASNVLTGSGTYGANGTEFTPSYSPDFPDRANVAPDDTVNGLSGTMDLPALNKVAPSDTLRGQNGTMDLPSLNKVAPTDTLEGLNGTMDLPAISSVIPEDTLEGVSGTANIDALANLPAENEVLTGSGNFGKNLDKVPSYSPDFPSVNSVLTTDTVNGISGTVVLPSNTKVKDDTTYGANSSITGLLNINDEANLPSEAEVADGVQFGENLEFEGTAGLDQPSTDPGEYNVLKDVAYVIDGVNKIGKYQTGELEQTSGDNIRIKILKEIENTLYRVNPAVSAIYQNCIKTVSIESGLKQGIIQDDMPFVQIIADDNIYDHKFVLSGNKPQVTMKVKFLIITPANWNLIDNESLYEDIRQAFIRDNFSLNGLVLSVKVVGVKPINSDSDKADDNRRAEMSLDFVFIEKITNLN